MSDPIDNSMNKPADSLLIEYMTMRKMIGWLGLSLPFILIIGSLLVDGQAMHRSISQYYHSSMQNIFVGVLFAQAVFLFAYRGYKFNPDKPGHNFFIRLSDNAAGNIAATAALGTALFPTTQCAPGQTCTTTVTSAIHWGSATLFFLTLAYICLCLFVQSGEIVPSIQKKKRNRTYKICGTIMLLAMALMGVKAALPVDIQTTLEAYHPIFWLETAAILAFGFSWLVKGEWIFADIPQREKES